MSNGVRWSHALAG